MARDLPDSWTMKDEWYLFTSDPRATGSHILATLDESTDDPTFLNGQDLRMGDRPIAWSRQVGDGRMVCSAIGHRREIYSDPLYRQMLINAIQRAAARGKSQTLKPGTYDVPPAGGCASDRPLHSPWPLASMQIVT